MVSIVKRVRGKAAFYYLYHDSKRGGRRQFERYLGRKIPDDIEEQKKEFQLEVERQQWLPGLEKIRASHRKEREKTPAEARKKNLKAFAVVFTYNTQRIEGSTLTLRETALLLEDGLTPTHRPKDDVREAENHEKLFFEMVRTTKELTLGTALEWNRKLLGGTKPGFAGRLRTWDVQIARSRFHPPPYEQIPLEIGNFFTWYKKNKGVLHPVELAALVHLRFVTIHPFGDGNGRISRIMMNHVLKQSGFPMLDIDYRDRSSYYNALERSQTTNNEVWFLKWFMRRYFKAHGRLLGQAK